MTDDFVPYQERLRREAQATVERRAKLLATLKSETARAMRGPFDVPFEVFFLVRQSRTWYGKARPSQIDSRLEHGSIIATGKEKVGYFDSSWTEPRMVVVTSSGDKYTIEKSRQEGLWKPTLRCYQFHSLSWNESLRYDAPIPYDEICAEVLSWHDLRFGFAAKS